MWGWFVTLLTGRSPRLGTTSIGISWPGLLVIATALLALLIVIRLAWLRMH